MAGPVQRPGPAWGWLLGTEDALVWPTAPVHSNGLDGVFHQPLGLISYWDSAEGFKVGNQDVCVLA